MKQKGRDHEGIEGARQGGVKTQNFVHLGKEFQHYLESGRNLLEDFEEQNNVTVMQATVALSPLSFSMVTIILAVSFPVCS